MHADQSNAPAHIVYLGLGSNQGDRQANLLAVPGALPVAVAILQSSSIYLTQPWGYTDQPPFLNQVLKAATSLEPQPLLAALKKAEAALGRKPTFRYGPRLIDIDILFYDDLILNQPRLQIPHPSLHERAFVLVPLAELAPDLVHPVLKVTITELLAGVEASDVLPVPQP